MCRIFIALLSIFVCIGCQTAERPEKAEPQKISAEISMKGMTVSQLGAHIIKQYKMSDIAVASVMGETAYEIFENPDDKAAAKLVISWTANDEGEPAVEDYRFTKAQLPAIDDEDAVTEFCDKLFQGDE